jgi:hypothetical protein
MKNIHLIPTNKPSRLFKFANQLHLDTIPKEYYKKYNIYITSDEEIKGWCLNIGNNEVIFVTKVDGNIVHHKPDRGCINLKDCKKIILTTDQDLIKDGVQAIDDEFLQWFIENPSCEFVEVSHQLHKDEPLYKIIIPQEENEKDFYKIGNFHENCDEGCKYHCTKGNTQIAECLECHFNNTSKEQIENDWKEAGKQTEGINSPTVEEFLEAQTQFKKQETLEEAIKREYETRKFNSDFPFDPQSFKLGTKWQQERMYSEEEVIEVLTQRCKEFGTKNEKFQKLLLKQDLEWFEQFKKK